MPYGSVADLHVYGLYRMYGRQETGSSSTNHIARSSDVRRQHTHVIFQAIRQYSMNDTLFNETNKANSQWWKVTKYLLKYCT